MRDAAPPRFATAATGSAAARAGDAGWAQLWALTRFDMVAAVRSPAFIVLLGIGIGLLVRYLFTSGATDATNRPRILGELWHALQFPVVAWVVVVTGRAALRHFQPVQMLNIVVPMLTALVIIRLAVVMLRQAVPHSGWVDRLAKTIGWIVWIGFVLHITGLAPDLIQFLDDLDFKPFWQHLGIFLEGGAEPL